MKGKKLLSAALALAMALSMMAFPGMAAYAGVFGGSSSANYTVDFSYNGATEKIMGDSKNYDLGAVFAGLGIQGEVRDIDLVDCANNVAKNDEGEVVFDIVKKGGSWLLNSYTSFDESFQMIVSTASATYAVTVTDPVAWPKFVFNTPQNGSYTVKYTAGEFDNEVESGDSVHRELTYCVTAVPSSGYEVDSVTFAGNAATKLSANYYSYSFADLPSSDVSVVVTFKAATPSNVCYLDTDSSDDTYLDSKTLDQNYTLSVSDEYTDVCKVKLEWSISDISATRVENKIWDPEHLVWVDDSGDPSVNVDPVTATFKLTNLSSIKVDAKVEFEALDDFDPEVEYTGVNATSHITTLGTVVKADHQVDKTITHDATVTVKLTPGDDDFTSATATSTASKYGSYTITLSQHAASTVCAHEESASVYSDVDNHGTHIYADQDTAYDSSVGAYCCVPLFCDYDEASAKYVCSGSNGHTAKEAAFADVNAEGWYYFNGTKFVRCAAGELHPNDEDAPTANAD